MGHPPRCCACGRPEASVETTIGTCCIACAKLFAASVLRGWRPDVISADKQPTTKEFLRAELYADLILTLMDLALAYADMGMVDDAMVCFCHALLLESRPVGMAAILHHTAKVLQVEQLEELLASSGKELD